MSGHSAAIGVSLEHPNKLFEVYMGSVICCAWLCLEL